MRKFLIILMVVAMASFLFVGCLFTPPNQTPIITSDPVKTATVGETYTYDVEATDPDDDVLTYSLTVMPSHMTIDSATGLIIWTPPAKGDYNVTVKVSDGNLDITQPFIITVSEPEPEPEPELVLVRITVLPEKMTLLVGETEAIKSVTATYVLKGYEISIAFKDCLFLTSNSKIATVDKDGIVTAVKAGTATITASYKGKMDTLAITVSAVELDHIVVLPEKITLEKYDSDFINSVTAHYSDETKDEIYLGDCDYESSDTDVAVVDKWFSKVEIWALSAGTADITVSYTEGGITKTDIVEVIVSEPEPVVPVAVTGVTLNQATLTLVAGGATGTLVEIVTPADATDPSVTWASSDKSVAIVSLGVVTSLNAGIGSITVTTVDGSFTATCIVTVTAAEEPPAEKSEAPVITSVPKADDGYINKEEEEEAGITVIGYSIDGSIIKLYLDDELIGTTVASKAKSVYAMFEFTDLDIDLGEDGEKTLYATAKEVGLAVSDASNTCVFTLDTTLPELETVSIDGKVFEDGDLVGFLTGESFETLTAEMSEPIFLVLPDEEPVVEITVDGEDYGPFATFEISDDGLTLTLTPATGIEEDDFYEYTEGEQVFSSETSLVKDAAGNKIVVKDFTLTFVEVPAPE